MKRYARRVSPMERYNLVIHRSYHYHVDGIVEGIGDLDPDTLRAAIAAAAAANPAIRVRWRGVLGFSRWVDSGIAPTLHVVDACAWDGASEAHAPFYAVRLDPPGPIADVWLLRCTDGRTRLVFRALHAAIDGRGMMVWITEVFRALRGETPRGSASVLMDIDVQAQHADAVAALKAQEAQAAASASAAAAQVGAAQTTAATAPVYASPYCLPVVDADPSVPLRYVWRRLRIDGPVSNQLARSLVFFAAHARRRGPGAAGFTVPIDYRGLRTDEMGLGNLTGYTRLAVSETDTPRSLLLQLNRKIKALTDVRGIPGIRLVWWLPVLHLVKSLQKKTATVLYTLNKDAPSAGVVSMGHWQHEWFSCPGFTATMTYGIPGSVGRLNVLFSNYDDCAVVTFAAPAAFNAAGQLDAMIAAYHEYFSA